MSKSIPSHLRVVAHEAGELQAPSEDVKSLVEFCRSFELATGWPLELTAGAENLGAQQLWSTPVELGVLDSPGHLRITSSGKALDNPKARASLKRAGSLAGAVAQLWGELIATRRALWQREADLAAGVPVAIRREDSSRLASRLEAILQAGAESLSCHAAAMYLLDEATTELKLRASWGLSRDRLLAPARPLEGSLADLEALLGHAVVLTDNQLDAYWKPPEHYASAVCVPIATADNPLGTLWIFSDEVRDFTDSQTNQIEVMGGSLAAELERRVLVDESLAAKNRARDLENVTRRGPQCPSVPPLSESWDVAGGPFQAQTAGGAFCDWFTQANGSLDLVLGCAAAAGVSGALTAQAVRAAVRAQATCEQPLARTLETVNSVLWSTSSGDEQASLFLARVADDGMIEYVARGNARVLIIRSGEEESLANSSPLVGASEVCSDLSAAKLKMQSGDWLLVYTHGLTSAITPDLLAGLGARGRNATEACRAAQAVLAERLAEFNVDHGLLVIRRR